MCLEQPTQNLKHSAKQNFPKTKRRGASGAFLRN